MQCPVCGKTKFPATVSARVCPVCEWHDDILQRNNHNIITETNLLSVNEQRIEFFLLNNKKTAARARRLQDRYYKDCEYIDRIYPQTHKIAYPDVYKEKTTKLDEARIRYINALTELLLSLLPKE